MSAGAREGALCADPAHTPCGPVGVVLRRRGRSGGIPA